MKLSLLSIDPGGFIRLANEGNITSADFTADGKNPFEALIGANWSTHRVLLDLDKTAFIDSAAIGWLIECCMMGVNLFMFWWGIKLVQTTWYQSIADFPAFSVGASYLPVPLGGLITALFVIERLWKLEFFVEPEADQAASVSTE